MWWGYHNMTVRNSHPGWTPSTLTNTELFALYWKIMTPKLSVVNQANSCAMSAASPAKKSPLTKYRVY